MQRQIIFDLKVSACLAKFPDGLRDSRFASMVPISVCKHQQRNPGIWLSNATIFLASKNLKVEIFRTNCGIQAAEFKESSDQNLAESSDEDEDDELCPVECVREFKTDNEFYKILDKAKETDTLVVVDFYRTACGSCKYIEQGFAKVCKRSGDQDAPVIFLKHNVIDEYDEQSEVAERLRIKTVPLFHFYKNGTLLEAFPTRDKERIVAAILKYTTPFQDE
ncbi:thioredoxin-like 4, chloroplastic [Aristolochia californica]|uniref:thioredoxin-like 4, chloroplastic n=1 Tax=Aristolochia californica TaxID=171875 RepID=UPI0035DAB578